MSMTAAARSYRRQVQARIPGHDVYRHPLTLIDGERLDLGDRRGRPTLIVNTATRCAFARQLHGLQYVYARYRDDGLLVIGCPSGDFGDFEYDEPAEIARVCHELYEIEFPLTEPMRVRSQPDGLWRDLAAQDGSGPPVWNFTKYLVDGNGRVCGWWSTNVQPNHARVREAIQRQLLR